MREIAQLRHPSESAKAAPLAVIQPVNDLIRSFPLTRYYGSKRKLLPWIYSHIGSLQFETAADLFGGTASVSYLLKEMRKSVTYNDGFRFNADVGRTILAQRIALFRKEVVDFIDAVTPSYGTISKYFTGVFYTAPENAWLDGFAIALTEANLPTEKQSLLRYLVYQACLKKRPFNLFHRANLQIRTNPGVVRTFGNSTTWEKSFRDHMLQAYDELPQAAPVFHKESVILASGNAEDVPAGSDLVYIDPPYINMRKRYARDDYWRRYHFLEGLACYPEWPQKIDVSSNIGLAQQPDWMEAWSRQESFQDRLVALIKKHSGSIVVLSYVTGAVPHENMLRAAFDEIFPSVSMHSTDHSHALSRSKKKELLFIGRPTK